MRACVRFVAGLLITLPALAHAAAVSPPGVNLRWDRCLADGGLPYRTFACDTNVGVERLVLSFELAEPKAGVRDIEFALTVVSVAPALPAWWEFRSTEACRNASSSLVLVKPTASPGCIDWAAGQATGAIVSYNIGAGGADQARLIGLVSTESPVPPDLEAGVEYFLATINVDHRMTVGSGACGGCDVPVCLSFDYARLNRRSATGNLLLDRAANWSGSRIVGWQRGYAASYTPARQIDGVFHHASMDCVPYDVTRSTHSTWGSVKSLYR